MKGGKTPIHIMRWAPADFENDEAVKLAGRRRNYRALAFYMAFINHSFMAGGDLPEDPERIAATLGWHRGDVEAALRYWLAEGKLVATDGRISHSRVVREVKEELAYRADQSALGKKGGEAAGRGRPKGRLGVPLIEDRGTPLRSIGPPSPAPIPLSPAPPPAPFSRPPGPANPLVAGRRESLERECLSLVGEVAVLTGEDPVEVIAQASGYQGAATTKLNPASMSDDRLANTVRDLRNDLAELKSRAARGVSLGR